jgi:putative iron-dependent peroxidase
LSRLPGAIEAVRSTLATIEDLTKSVSIRDAKTDLVCTAAIGSDAWDPITKKPRPKELRPLPVYRGKKHASVLTDGDLFFHIRADRFDMCFELEKQVLNSLGNAVEVLDETVGFRYFDSRDLLGFADGTANPVGGDVPDSVLVTGEDDPGAAGGSYVVAQKYLHDLSRWSALNMETQEEIIGRRKLENTELSDARSGQKAHKTLTSIEDEQGEEQSILRDNMPFGSPASGQFGTYFIGYSRKLWVIERMLERMFVGDPPGMHDRILDYSTPITGVTFFAPCARFLESLA